MTYPRIKIAGMITTLSEMTAASGSIGEFEQKTKHKKEQTALQYSEICLDTENKPYLPASSLRGLLSSISTSQQSQHHIGLFGDSENKKAGKLRIYDATWKGDKPPRSLHSHNAINPITGTAKDQHLYNDAYVPEHSKFDWLIEADQIEQTELEYIFSLLQELKENPRIQLGKGQSKQRGLFRWEVKESAKPVQALTQENLIGWLKGGDLVYTDINKIDSVAIHVGDTQLISYPLVFTALSPILVNNPALVKDGTNSPNLEFYRNSKNQLIIPASSLMGVLRSQCRKILLTLRIANAEKTPQDNLSEENEHVDKLIAELFGSTAQQSRIWLKDAVAVGSTNCEHTQIFNAVDRFTGGVTDGALYTAHAASPKVINSTLMIDTRRQALTDWQKGLLILLLRDALEADLAVGWGKSKGYGCLQLSKISLEGKEQMDWEEIKKLYGIEVIQGWVDHLNAACTVQTEEERS